MEGKSKGSRAAQQRAKTHCPKGHEYDELNTYVRSDGSRDCRTCERKRMRMKHDPVFAAYLESVGA